MKYLFALLVLVFAPHAFAEETINSEKEKFKVVPMIDGLEHPWSLAFLPGGDMLVTERDGKLNLIRKDFMKRDYVTGVPTVTAGGQGGLLDVLVHPDFTENRIIFLSYSAQDAEGNLGTEVYRAKLNGPRLENGKIIFRVEPKTPDGNNHFGSRILWGPDGKLYITLGDRFTEKEQAQNPHNHLGTIVRINEDGSAPDDNPFVKGGGAKEVFTYGNRNVQGIALQPGTDKIWMHEHGPRGGDEVNIVKAGANYGWPKVTYGVDYSGAVISNKTEGEGYEPSVIHWTPSIAPSGMTFYSGDKFPGWNGDIFVGALAATHLRRLEVEGNKITGQEELLADLGERIRDVRSGPDGYIYIVTDDSNGQVLRLEPVD